MSPPINACKTLVFCTLAAFFTLPVGAQTLTTQGVESALSGPLSGDQVFPSASIGISGGYLVFQGTQIDGKGIGIGALRLDSNLGAVGTPFAVNQRPLGSQQQPSVALLSGGGAIVTWQGGVKKGSSDVFARFLRRDGTFLTGDIQVSSPVITMKTNHVEAMHGYQNNRLRNLRYRLLESARVSRDHSYDSQAIALPDGGALVAYSGSRRIYTNWMQILQVVKTSHNRSITNDLPQKFSARQDWMQDVYFQRFDATGKKAGGEVVVNQYTRNNQRNPSVAVLPSGDFVVVWTSENFIPASIQIAHTRVDIMGRIFRSNGQPSGDEFVVNSGVRLSATPVVSAMSDGRFTVVWAARDGVRTNGWDIYARAFNSAGTPLAADFLLNDHTYGDQFAPRISSVGTNQLVIWNSLGQDKIQNGLFTQITSDGGLVSIPIQSHGSWQSVYGRLLSDGAPGGAELRVNSTFGKQLHPQLSSDQSGRFLVTWSHFEVGSGFNVYSQAYSTPPPPAGTNTSLAGVNGGQAGGQAAVAGVTFSGPLDKLRLHWNTETGARYQVQSSEDLKTWTNLNSPRSGSGLPDYIGIEPGRPKGFFRVLRVP
jgi:hypothetical protein